MARTFQQIIEQFEARIDPAITHDAFISLMISDLAKTVMSLEENLEAAMLTIERLEVHIRLGEERH